ncbi:hypothetical protein DAI22_09g070133 [Oryza sativa Japonica Group]|nr:hypothetical protein DAI22_09g070133 [Oryza sativa Japonica Group]
MHPLLFIFTQSFLPPSPFHSLAAGYNQSPASSHCSSTAAAWKL